MTNFYTFQLNDPQLADFVDKSASARPFFICGSSNYIRSQDRRGSIVGHIRPRGEGGVDGIRDPQRARKRRSKKARRPELGLLSLTTGSAEPARFWLRLRNENGVAEVSNGS